MSTWCSSTEACTQERSSLQPEVPLCKIISLAGRSSKIGSTYTCEIGKARLPFAKSLLASESSFSHKWAFPSTVSVTRVNLEVPKISDPSQASDSREIMAFKIQAFGPSTSDHPIPHMSLINSERSVAQCNDQSDDGYNKERS